MSARTSVNLRSDYSGADIVLRSHDFHHFRVPKTPVVNGSHILGGLIQRNSASFDSTDAESLPVVPLPESGEILHCLLTFIFLAAPRMPSTHEEARELLSVAQKYQMEAVLIHIQGSIAQRYRHPPI